MEIRSMYRVCATVLACALPLAGCLPPPTTFGLRASGDAADAGELRLTGVVGAGTTFNPTPSPPAPLGAGEVEVGLTDHLAVRSRVTSLNGPWLVEGEVLADAELDGPWLLGARLGAGWLPWTTYVRPHAGVVAGLQQGMVQGYIGGTVNPTFQGATWLQGHTGVVLEPVSRRGLRGGVELMGQAAAEDVRLQLVPQLFIGAAL